MSQGPHDYPLLPTSGVSNAPTLSYLSQTDETSPNALDPTPSFLAQHPAATNPTKLSQTTTAHS